MKCFIKTHEKLKNLICKEKKGKDRERYDTIRTYASNANKLAQKKLYFFFSKQTCKYRINTQSMIQSPKTMSLLQYYSMVARIKQHQQKKKKKVV